MHEYIQTCMCSHWFFACFFLFVLCMCPCVCHMYVGTQRGHKRVLEVWELGTGGC